MTRLPGWLARRHPRFTPAWVSPVLTLALALLLVGACSGQARDDGPLATADTAATSANVGDSSVTLVANSTTDGYAVTMWTGFGPALFGGNEESVRMAWGRPLTDGGAASTRCRQLFPEPQSATGYALSFMLDDGVFTRYDVLDTAYTAPGGGKVGMTRDAVASVFGARAEQIPHKYVDGAHYITVTSPDDAKIRLIFETDASGVITRWRVGTMPSVAYVEGCA